MSTLSKEKNQRHAVLKQSRHIHLAIYLAKNDKVVAR
jgi:hypothetical protein